MKTRATPKSKIGTWLDILFNISVFASLSQKLPLSWGLPDFFFKFKVWGKKIMGLQRVFINHFSFVKIVKVRLLLRYYCFLFNVKEYDLTDDLILIRNKTELRLVHNQMPPVYHSQIQNWHLAWHLIQYIGSANCRHDHDPLVNMLINIIKTIDMLINIIINPTLSYHLINMMVVVRYKKISCR